MGAFFFSSFSGFCPWVKAAWEGVKGPGAWQLEPSPPELTRHDPGGLSWKAMAPSLQFLLRRMEMPKKNIKFTEQPGSGCLAVGKVRSCRLPSLLLPPAPLPPLPPSLPPPSPAHSSWFIFGCKFMAPFVFLILLQTILKPQTFLLGANKLNTCMPPRQNINCGVLMNDVVLDSETKQAVSLHHCLLPPRVSGSRMSTQPTDCFYFILSFPFFKPAVPILGLLCWNRAQAL